MSYSEEQAPPGMYPLLVMQYEIVGHPTRTEHWSLEVLRDNTIAEVHELQGNFDTFEYSHKSKASPGTSQDFRGGCVIGYLNPEQVSRPAEPGTSLSDSDLIRWLRSIEVIKGTPTFDCQVWIINALVVLREQGVILPGINERIIRDELKRESERDEYGEELIHERIFNKSKPLH